MKLNEYIDHTLLKPDATHKDIERLCQEALKHKFASVCVAPYWVHLCLECLDNKIPITTVIGFPHGNSEESSKSQQIIEAIMDGATEMDVVINVGAIKSGRWEDVESEIEEVALTKKYRHAQSRSIKIKYIVEIGYLTDYELFRVTDLLIEHKIDYVKTCTGYGPRGVEIEDIEKLKKHVGDRIGIKASGGIKTKEFCERLIKVGANRIGASSSVKFMG